MLGLSNNAFTYIQCYITDEELEALKQEFTHHQDKVDEYKSLLKNVDAGDQERHKSLYNLTLPCQ